MNRSSVFAYVTLVTNADYAMGATALARSLRRTGTGADIVILHTGGVDAAALFPLKALDCRLIEVEHLPLSDAFNPR
ncbi:glycosyl transferase, partial [Rhizobium ruizarguesonis]